ncbi:MAG: hypothetical protein P4L53_03830 [Candidatus Obscuribacterales bacterium]|nr:hypothetical protein [Candidatus Obscuribacterales bacterium]
MKNTMSRINKIALAAGLGLNLFALSALAQTAEPSLTEVTAESAQSTLLTSSQPIGILLVSPGCEKCTVAEATILGAISRHPAMTFVKADASIFNQGPFSEPAFGVFVPGLGVVYTRSSFNPSADDIDAFLDERASKIAAETSLVNQAAALSAKIADADAPFIAQLKSLEEQGTAGLAPLNEQLKSLHGQMNAAVQPYNDKIDQLNKKLEEVTKPYSDALAPLKEQLKEAGTPFKTQADDVIAAARKATQGLVTQLKAARDAHDKQQFDAIQAKFLEVSTPFNNQLLAVKEKYEAATAPILAQMAPIQKKGDDAASPILIEINTAQLLAKEETKALNEQIGDLTAEADALKAPLDAQAVTIGKARSEALKPFTAELAKTKSELAALIKADKS